MWSLPIPGRRDWLTNRVKLLRTFQNVFVMDVPSQSIGKTIILSTRNSSARSLSTRISTITMRGVSIGQTRTKLVRQSPHSVRFTLYWIHHVKDAFNVPTPAPPTAACAVDASTDPDVIMADESDNGDQKHDITFVSGNGMDDTEPIPNVIKYVVDQRVES
jgi:hypothetical protein